MDEKPDQGESIDALATTVLEGEAARRDAQSADVLFPDDLLPGVGGEQSTLMEGLRKGGFRTFLVLLALNSLDELENSAVAILGPDIGESFGVSDGAITAISTASLMFFVLGAGPMGWLADRLRRGPIVGVASAAFAAFSALSGAAVNALMFFFMRFFAGMSKANTITVHPSMLADTYPLSTRGRMYATNAGVGRVFAALSPILAGGIAVWVGGDDGWRWAFYLLGLPTAALAVLAFFLREPPRGQWEQKHVLGSGLKQDRKMPMSVEAAFTRIWNIDTIRNMTIAFAAMGFALFPAGSIQSFFLEEEFGLDALERGLAVAPAGIGLVMFLPVVGRRFDATFRSDPDRAMRLIGILLVPIGVLVPIQYAMGNLGLFIAFSALNSTLLGGAFAMVQPSIQAVFPYRLRGMGTAFLTFFMVMVGGVGGSLIAGFLQNELGEQTAITIITATAMPVGAYFVLRGAGRLRRDLSLIVSELQEEQAEERRQAETAPEDLPAIQVADVDFSYGQVQVLFDLSLEVRRQETLALLGTNGAGKSTALKVITGLVTPERGVVRLHGQTITFATPEQRAAMGVHMLPGGAGVWSDLSIGDNLLMGAYAYRKDRDDRDRRIAKVLEMFPDLARRPNERAGNLSGGQQQMLALARVMLHEPEVLIIDELSLGLAPVVVQSLLETIEGLKAQGQTMIIVEQSLNVALAISDRAVFLEKGHVRFEGSARELAERDDLARAVFLGREGG
ncbi:MFS transporter [Candidatus Poriferisocius sp.]|uniref:MFS transporter n=1 Tax=Candidatus Poriferisocius sp. TaxID=3101276 RepID=UPI003B5B633C